MTSIEIARLAGVSRSTVSRVLNGYDNVPEETYEKVMKVVREYDYTPNFSARALAGMRTNVIGVFLVERQKKQRNTIYNNAFVGSFLNAIIDIAAGNNYYVLTYMINSANGKEEFSKIKQSFLEKRIDAAIVVDADDYSIPYLNELIDKNFSVCFIDIDAESLTYKNKSSNAAVVNATNYSGACDAMEYLVRLGHKKIGFVKGAGVTYSAKERYRAYKDVMDKYNIDIEPSFVLEGDFSNTKTMEELTKMLNMCKGSLPTAMLCSNDDMALTVINVLNEYGYKVPEDVSVIGFDNVNISKYSIPSLTTVENPIFEIAEKTMEALSDVKHKKTNGLRIFEIPTNLIIRDSCSEII